MLSTTDLERLIAVKRREIEKEKTRLGLASPRSDNNKENETTSSKHVREGARKHDASLEKEGEEEIPPDLERYIRRYLGLPVMLKAGEYSPNNPLIRGERTSGDALLGLGEYERRRNTLRKLRQQQYREYLDQQAKKKQEEKEEAERIKREREQRETEQERERERERLERERASPERPRAHTSTVFNPTHSFTSKVDTAVQTVRMGRPLSVAVQTDDAELYRLSDSPSKWQLTQAERELSPRTVMDARPAHPQRRSYGDFEQESMLLKRRQSDERHYKPSLFDADAISLRNAQAEKEAAAKRQSYQQELRNQIQEQQRIREERKAREKMLEQAEMRRLEEQLRMLRVAQERELGRQGDLDAQMRENATDYEKKRTALQKEIDMEQALLRVKPTNRRTHTSQSDTLPSKLPFYYPTVHGRDNVFKDKKPFSTNIPDNSIFSPNYDVDSYLRKNLNPSKESLLHNRLDTSSSENVTYKYLNNRFNDGKKTDFCQEKLTGYSPRKATGYSYNDEKTGYDDDERKHDVSNDRITDYNLHKKIHDNDNINTNKHKIHENDNINANKHTNILENYNTNANKHKIYENDTTNTNKHKIHENDNTNTNKHKILENDNINANKHKKMHENDNSNDENNYNSDKRVIIEKAIIHERPKDKIASNRNDDNPIPVLRHSPIVDKAVNDNNDLSDAMQMVDVKWKVPVVQKNILKSLPNEEGKNVNILTQLGSIRRQLQLEQLKLDRMITK